MVNSIMVAINLNQPVKILCESFSLEEQVDEETGEVTDVFMTGVAITFNKPTRNRVAYSYQSGLDTHKTLIGRPFLDSHHDDTIRQHPPFGHVTESYPGVNSENGLPCLNYKVSVDPTETDFIRKVRRGDINKTSIQVVVKEVIERQDEYGDYLEAVIQEFLELSAVLIPGDGDTSINLVERFKEQQQTYNSPDKKQKNKPLMGIPEMEDDKESEQTSDTVNPSDLLDEDEVPIRLTGCRRTEFAYKNCLCPVDGKQMFLDRYKNGFVLRCGNCGYTINKRKEVV